MRDFMNRTAMNVAALAAAATLLGACGPVSDTWQEVTAEDTCQPGRSVECACPGGAAGAQACQEDGLGYSACVCEESQTQQDAEGAGSTSLGEGPDLLPTDSAGSGAAEAEESETASSELSAPAGPGVTAERSPPLDSQPPQPALPDVEVELRSAQVRYVLVGAALAAEANLDWNASDAEGLLVDLQVLSSQTYRSWTTILSSQPASYFASVSLPVTQGERRFDFRAVARDVDGNTWTSNVITVQ